MQRSLNLVGVEFKSLTALTSVLREYFIHIFVEGKDLMFVVSSLRM